MISSAHHEYAKEKARKENKVQRDDNSRGPLDVSHKEVPANGDAGKKGDKRGLEDKEIMRTAIAGTLIVIYIVVLATSIFTNPFSSDKDTVFKTTFDNFGNVIIVVVGFYFGSKGAIQIYRMYKGGKDDDPKNGSHKQGGKNNQPDSQQDDGE